VGDENKGGNRRLRWAILAFALGAAWLRTQATLPASAWMTLLLPLALAAWLFRRDAGWRGWLGRIVLVLLAGALGFLYAGWRADLRLADDLPRYWQGRDVELVGRVVGLPETTATSARFVFRVAAVETPGARVPTQVRLVWSGYRGEPPPILVGGDCLRLTARLNRPRGNVNPGGFDYPAWLLERNIRAVGGLIGRPVSATACSGAARAGLDRAREWTRARIRAALGDAPYAGVVVALAVGDQDAITSAQWTLFRRTGTTHLFSVSGLHITLFSALVFAGVRRIWRSLPGLNARVPAARAGIVLGWCAATGYTALAGFGIPAQRTLLMLTAGAVFALFDRVPTASRLLAVALAVVVAVDPWAAFAPGFWLSFGAVAALLYAGMGRLRAPPPWRVWVRAQWAVTVALAPLLLALFNEVSLVSPLANAVAIPLVSLLAVPLALLAAVSPWDGIAWAAHAVIVLVTTCMEWLVRLPQPLFHAATPDLAAILLALLGAGLWLLPRGFPARWLGVVLFLPLLFPRLPTPPQGQAWVTVLDVGQGTAVLVRTARHALVVDTGPAFMSGEDAGARIVAPALWHLGIGRLDGLVVSHDDIDHSGGAMSLLGSHRPAWLLSSIAGMADLGPTGRALRAARPDMVVCEAGHRWHWDGVDFQVLHPPTHHYAHPGFSDNARSCVVRVSATPATGGPNSLLIPGDVERLAEMNLLERDALAPTDVLVSPHHGSGGSSSAEFLAATRPRWVIIPVGHRNRFGHPHPDALARYRAIGAGILRTDRDGAVSVRLGAGPVEPERARSTAPRYWWE